MVGMSGLLASQTAPPHLNSKVPTVVEGRSGVKRKWLVLLIITTVTMIKVKG